MYNVFIFSGGRMMCCVGLNYIVDVVSVSDDGTQILLGSSQTGVCDHFCIASEGGAVNLELKAHVQYSLHGHTRALVCTNSCTLAVDNAG